MVKGTAYLRVINDSEAVKDHLSEQYTVDNRGKRFKPHRHRYDHSLALKETAAGSGDINMDESTKLILDRMDKDIREHKQETRDRDARLQSEMQEREKRTHEEAVAREERMISLFNEMKNEFKEVKTDFNTKLDKLESNVSKKLDKVEQDINSKLDSVESKADNTYKHISSITIATIGAIGACIIAVGAIVITVLMK